MSYEILGLVTNIAKSRFIDALINGWAIQVTHFCVGSQGHFTDSPITSKTPDPTLNPTVDANGDSLPEDLIYGPKLVEGYTLGSGFNPAWSCFLDKREATGVISSYYLLAKYTYLPGAPSATLALLDKLWIFAYAYSPIKVKTDVEDFTFNLGVQF